MSRSVATAWLVLALVWIAPTTALASPIWGAGIAAATTLALVSIHWRTTWPWVLIAAIAIASVATRRSNLAQRVANRTNVAPEH